MKHQLDLYDQARPRPIWPALPETCRAKLITLWAKITSNTLRSETKETAEGDHDAIEDHASTP